MSVSPDGRRRSREAARRTIARGAMVMPGQFARRRTPTWVLHRVPQKVDGVTLDHVEAAVLFADQPWAKNARYLGVSRGWHVWEREPG